MSCLLRVGHYSCLQLINGASYKLEIFERFVLKSNRSALYDLSLQAANFGSNTQNYSFTSTSNYVKPIQNHCKCSNIRHKHPSSLTECHSTGAAESCRIAAASDPVRVPTTSRLDE